MSLPLEGSSAPGHLRTVTRVPLLGRPPAWEPAPARLHRRPPAGADSRGPRRSGLLSRGCGPPGADHGWDTDRSRADVIRQQLFRRKFAELSAGTARRLRLAARFLFAVAFPDQNLRKRSRSARGDAASGRPAWRAETGPGGEAARSPRPGGSRIRESAGWPAPAATASSYASCAAAGSPAASGAMIQPVLERPNSSGAAGWTRRENWRAARWWARTTGTRMPGAMRVAARRPGARWGRQPGGTPRGPAGRPG
jgi:hypothetical protein